MILEQYERADLITAENGSESSQAGCRTKLVESRETEPAAPDAGPRYHKSRSAEEWRAYHRDYCQVHAERRRQQKKASHRRMALVRAYARYGGIVPKRIIRMLFLRNGSVGLQPDKSWTSN